MPSKRKGSPSRKRSPSKRRPPLRPDEKSPRSGVSPIKASPEKSPKPRSPAKSLKGTIRQGAPAKSAISKKGSAVAAVAGGAVAEKKKEKKDKHLANRLTMIHPPSALDAIILGKMKLYLTIQ